MVAPLYRLLGSALLATFTFAATGCAAESTEDAGSTESMMAAAGDSDGPAAAPAAREGEKVLIVFAGFERARIKELARDLTAQGWNLPDGERGGERVEHIRGMNEVRFFHAEDAERAHALAGAVSKLQTVKVLDFSDTRLGASVARGQLEVWISASE